MLMMWTTCTTTVPTTLVEVFRIVVEKELKDTRGITRFEGMGLVIRIIFSNMLYSNTSALYRAVIKSHSTSVSVMCVDKRKCVRKLLLLLLMPRLSNLYKNM